MSDNENEHNEHDSKHAADGSSNTISLLSEDDSDNDATTKASKQPRDAASGGVQAPQASATRPFNEEQQNALHVLLVLMQTTRRWWAQLVPVRRW